MVELIVVLVIFVLLPLFIWGLVQASKLDQEMRRLNLEERELRWEIGQLRADHISVDEEIQRLRIGQEQR
jgi:type II secretory pathway component PulJ